MTTTEYANAGSATRAVKKLIDDPAIQVNTSWCINVARDGYGWHSVIHLQRGEQRNAVVARLVALDWQVSEPNAYDTFVSAYLPAPEPKGDAQRGEAFLTGLARPKTEF